MSIGINTGPPESQITIQYGDIHLDCTIAEAHELIADLTTGETGTRLWCGNRIITRLTLDRCDDRIMVQWERTGLYTSRASTLLLSDASRREMATYLAGAVDHAVRAYANADGGAL